MKRLIDPGRRIPDVQGEPNFYEIAERFPLPPDPNAAGDESAAMEVQALTSRASGEDKISDQVQKLVPQFSRLMPRLSHQPKPKPVRVADQNPKHGISCGAHQQGYDAAVNPAYPKQVGAANYDPRPSQVAQPSPGSFTNNTFPHTTATGHNFVSNPHPPTVPRLDLNHSTGTNATGYNFVNNPHPPTVPRLELNPISIIGSHQRYQFNLAVPPTQQHALPHYARYPPQCHSGEVFSNSAHGSAAPQLDAYYNQATSYTSNRLDASTQPMQNVALGNITHPTTNSYHAAMVNETGYEKKEAYSFLGEPEIQTLRAIFDEAARENTEAYSYSYQGDEQKASVTSLGYTNAYQNIAGAAPQEPFCANDANIQRDRSLSFGMWADYLTENSAMQGTGEGSAWHDASRR